MLTKIYKKSRTRKICKSMIKISLLMSLIICILSLIFSTNPCSQGTRFLLPNFKISYSKYTQNSLYQSSKSTPTNISHIVFGIASVVKTWPTKRHYVESWWKPNITRGFLFLDQAPKNLPWPPTSPPLRVSNVTINKKGNPHVIRLAQVVEETFKAENTGVRWYVIGDEDTVFFLDNLLEVLKKYNHNGYYYIGMNSESVISNSLFSFGMGFGGAGIAFSRPLAEILVKNLGVCLEKYQYIRFSDRILQSCVADLGVSLTQEKGFHQIDLHSNISGLLSALPQTPLVSLHHLDRVEPLFPAMDRPQSLQHLMKAAKTDQSRLFQQRICYNHPKNWSISVSWGYSVQIYESAIPPSLLQVPLQTFTEWRRGASPAFMMNTRPISNDSCEMPHYFYFDSVEGSSTDGGGGMLGQVVTNYVRRFPRQLPPCLVNENHSADHVEKIMVISPVTRVEMELEENAVTLYNRTKQMLQRSRLDLAENMKYLGDLYC